MIGLIHVADVPGRHQPGTGEINYANIYRKLAELNYRHAVAMEFHPIGDPVATLRAAKQMVSSAMRTVLSKQPWRSIKSPFGYLVPLLPMLRHRKYGGIDRLVQFHFLHRDRQSELSAQVDVDRIRNHVADIRLPVVRKLRRDVDILILHLALRLDRTSQEKSLGSIR